jgi:uncharacterized protein (DUF362 family)
MNTGSAHKDHPNRGLSRRNFLRLAGVTAAGLLAEGCKPKKEQYESSSNAQPGGAKVARVAIGKIDSYEREAVDKQVFDLIDKLGGLGDIVKPGDSVAIKINMTGGVKNQPLPGVSAIESYITHPEVVRALIKQVQVAGAKEVYVVEAAYEWASFVQWGFEEMVNSIDAKLLDLNDTKPYDDFVEVKVGEGSFIYPSFILNKFLTEVNVFMSVSKMKNHYNAGVTHTMKNLYGLAPLQKYETKRGDGYRTAFHGTSDQTRTRLPRVIVDINRARPIHFSLIDGIKTAEAGEGPWISTMTPVQPGVLIAGKNAVATDAVATAVMGHDPTANYPDEPFIRCDNHLNLAAAMGLGTNRLDEIEVIGQSIEKVRYNFTPAK